MFGYISINKAEMKFKDYDVYHSYYCGLCKVLKECYGRRGQVTLSFDMTFLVILLTGLYEPDTKTEMVRCIAHPMQKHAAKTNEFTEYAASQKISPKSQNMRQKMNRIWILCPDFLAISWLRFLHTATMNGNPLFVRSDSSSENSSI